MELSGPTRVRQRFASKLGFLGRWCWLMAIRKIRFYLVPHGHRDKENGRGEHAECEEDVIAGAGEFAAGSELIGIANIVSGTLAQFGCSDQSPVDT